MSRAEQMLEEYRRQAEEARKATALGVKPPMQTNSPPVDSSVATPGQDSAVRLQIQQDPSFLEFLIRALRQGSLNPEPPNALPPEPRYRMPIIEELRRPSKTMGVRG